MKVILYMEMTLNGFIAKPDDNTEWISEEAWNSYTSVMNEMGAIVIGNRTYNLMPEEEFQKDVEYVVVSFNNESVKKVPNVIFSNDSPKEIVEQLRKKAYEKVCVAGGRKTNAAFMKEGLIDEMYLDVEPLIFGKGTPLFTPSDFEYELELLETKKLNENTIQLHYKVLK